MDVAVTHYFFFINLLVHKLNPDLDLDPDFDFILILILT